DRKLFLEHKNSEPAMKILMRNIGMTLHVIHKLRAEGVTNIQVNMDWQHLLMNGENLAEYAAMLAAEGLLGHQHANSGWAGRSTVRTASGSASTSSRTPRTRSRPCGGRSSSGASSTRSRSASTTPPCGRRSS